MLSNVPFDLWTSIFGFIEPMQQHETLGTLLCLNKSHRAHFIEILGTSDGAMLLDSIVFKQYYRSRKRSVLKKVTDMLSSAETRICVLLSQPQRQPDVQRLLRHAAKILYVYKDLSSQQDTAGDVKIDAQRLSVRFPQLQCLRLDGCELIEEKSSSGTIFEHLEELTIENVFSQQADFQVLRRLPRPLRRLVSSTFKPLQLHPSIDLTCLESFKMTYPFSDHSFLLRLTKLGLRELEVNWEYWRLGWTDIQSLCTLIDRNSSTLERIAFHQGFMVEDLNKMVITSLVHCKKLQTLSLQLLPPHDRPGDFAPAMHALAKLPALESLSIEANVSKLTAESCVALFRLVATKLSSFSIKDGRGHGHSQITVQYLIDSLGHVMGSKLRQLRVSGTHSVDCEGLVAAINAHEPALDLVELELGDVGNSHQLLGIKQLVSCSLNRLLSRGPMASVLSSLRCLHSHKRLHRLVLGNTNFKYLIESQAAAVLELSSAFRVCTCLKELELFQFGIISSDDNDDLIRQFCDGLVASNSITHLTLGDGVEFLMGFQLFRLEPIRETVYDYPQPSQEPDSRSKDVTIETLSYIIKNAKQLRTLSLKSDRYLAKPAVLAEAIAHEGCRLMHLDIIVHETHVYEGNFRLTYVIPKASELTTLLARAQGPELQSILVRKQLTGRADAQLYNNISAGIRKRKSNRLKDVDIRVEFI